LTDTLRLAAGFFIYAKENNFDVMVIIPDFINQTLGKFDQ
jgi:hypothetical protein